MIKFKIIKCSWYDRISDDLSLNKKESGEYYINKDIEYFYKKHPDIDILDINLISHERSLVVVIKYKE